MASLLQLPHDILAHHVCMRLDKKTLWKLLHTNKHMKAAASVAHMEQEFTKQLFYSWVEHRITEHTWLDRNIEQFKYIRDKQAIWMDNRLLFLSGKQAYSLPDVEYMFSHDVYNVGNDTFILEDNVWGVNVSGQNCALISQIENVIDVPCYKTVVSYAGYLLAFAKQQVWILFRQLWNSFIEYPEDLDTEVHFFRVVCCKWGILLLSFHENEGRLDRMMILDMQRGEFRDVFWTGMTPSFYAFTLKDIMLINERTLFLIPTQSHLSYGIAVLHLTEIHGVVHAFFQNILIPNHKKARLYLHDNGLTLYYSKTTLDLQLTMPETTF